MNTKSGPGPVLCVLAAAMALIGFVGVAGAAYPASVTGSSPQWPGISDPLHGISGVVAVPQSQMRDGQASRGLVERLTQSVFGPNVDASLNQASVQNETTIA